MIGPDISGEKVNLRRLRNDDLARRVEWLNDEETVRLFTGMKPDRPYTSADAERWRHGVETDPVTRVWAIDTKDGRHIGDVDIHDINGLDASARLTILIGETDGRDRGYGTDAVKVVLCYAFEELRLRSVNLRVCDFNRRAIRCYEKCGFAHAKTEILPPGFRDGDVFMVATSESFEALRARSGAL